MIYSVKWILCFGIIIVVLQSLSSSVLAQDNPVSVKYDFETGDLQGWKVVEGKFGKILCNREFFLILRKNTTSRAAIISRPWKTKRVIPMMVLQGLSSHRCFCCKSRMYRFWREGAIMRILMWRCVPQKAKRSLRQAVLALRLCDG